MTVRIEHDLLGDREIPAEAYWGIHTLRAVENFKISNQKISDVPQFVRSMVMEKSDRAGKRRTGRSEARNRRRH